MKEEEMKDEMFLIPGYFEALKLVSEFGYRNRDNATEKSFVLRFDHSNDDRDLVTTVYVRPDEFRVYLFELLSREYENVRVVPQVIWDIVKSRKKDKKLNILQLQMSIDAVNMEDVAGKKDYRSGFGFWAVKAISFKGTSEVLFRGQVIDFDVDASSARDEFEAAYMRY